MLLHSLQNLIPTKPSSPDVLRPSISENQTNTIEESKQYDWDEVNTYPTDSSESINELTNDLSSSIPI